MLTLTTRSLLTSLQVAKLRDELAAALQELDETSQYVRALEERLESLGYQPVGMASIDSTDSTAAATASTGAAGVGKSS
jgi:hypothetical protein